jgi:hypothetical protein
MNLPIKNSMMVDPLPFRVGGAAMSKMGPASAIGAKATSNRGCHADCLAR